MHATRAEVSDLLRHHGISPTRQRVEITHALFTGGTHVSAEQLLGMVNLNQDESSKATIYNTLKILLDKGLVRAVIVDPQRVFYDPNTAPHHHFYNVATGELADIETDSLALDALPRIPAGVVLERVDVVIRVRPEAAAAPRE